MDELWKPIPGHVGEYEVSNTGRVRSVARMVRRDPYPPFKVAGRILAVTLDGDGYSKVALGRKSQRKIHRLVAEAFIENPGKLPEVDHIDTNKQNCAASNLRWCTRRENAHFRHVSGGTSCETKITSLDIAALRDDVTKGMPILHAAKKYGVSRVHVRRLCAPDEHVTCVGCGIVFVRPAVSTKTFCPTCRTPRAGTRYAVLTGAGGCARIIANGKTHHLGSFDTPERAHAAYLTAKRKLHDGCTI